MKIKQRHKWLVDLVATTSMDDKSLLKAYKAQYSSVFGEPEDFTPGQQRILAFNKLVHELQVDYPTFFKKDEIRGFDDFESKIHKILSDTTPTYKTDSADVNLRKRLVTIQQELMNLKKDHEQIIQSTSAQASALTACRYLLDTKFHHPKLQSVHVVENVKSKNIATGKSKINPVLVTGLVIGGVLLAVGAIALVAATGGLAALGIAAGVGVAAIAAPAAVAAAGAAIMSAVGIRHVNRKNQQKKELDVIRGVHKKGIQHPVTHLHNKPSSAIAIPTDDWHPKSSKNSNENDTTPKSKVMPLPQPKKVTEEESEGEGEGNRVRASSLHI